MDGVSMVRKLVMSVCLLLLSAATVVADDKGSGTGTVSAAPAVAAAAAGQAQPASAPLQGEGQGADGEAKAKQLKGMAVLGNNEAPMSLFIVPWKTSELGVETNLHRSLNERDVPVDRDVFAREVEFYEVSVGGKTVAPPAVVSRIAQ